MKWGIQNSSDIGNCDFLYYKQSVSCRRRYTQVKHGKPVLVVFTKKFLDFSEFPVPGTKYKYSIRGLILDIVSIVDRHLALHNPIQCMI